MVPFLYAAALYVFYFRYVPLAKPFQFALFPILCAATLLTATKPYWGVLFFILTFPLINNLPYFFGIFEPLPHAPAALVLFLFFFFGWLIHESLFREYRPTQQNIFKPIVLFSLVVFTSGVITFFRYANFFPFLSDSIYELKTNVYGTSTGGAIMSIVFNSLNYLSGCAFFLILLENFKSKKFIKKILVLILVSTFLSLSFGLYQHFGHLKIGSSPISINAGLINATFKDALSLGGYLSIMMALILSVGFAFRGFTWIISFLIFALSAYVILFSGSKTGFFSLLLSLSLFTMISLTIAIKKIKLHFPPLKKILPRFAITLILLATFIFAVIHFDKSISKELRQSRTILRVMSTKSFLEFGGRPDALWKPAVAMMKSYPLTGVGIGGFIIEMSNYYQTQQIPQREPESAENYILQAGSELGLIGLSLVLWIFWEIWRQIKKSYKKISSRQPDKFILVGAIAGILAFLLNIQTHSYIGSYEIKYSFWLLVGLIYGLFNIHQPETQGNQEKAPASAGKEPGSIRKPIFTKQFRILSVALVLFFGALHLWNSTHSLSLKSSTERFGIKQEFGLDKLEKTKDGREFRWTREYGGMTLKIEKPILRLSLHASHPDIQKEPISVKIYLVKEFFKHYRLLKEIPLNRNDWQDVTLSVQEELGQEVILLIKVSRTWNPLKTNGTPDPRNLGVAISRIEFKDNI
jgi:hypothetical protein